VPVQQTTAKMIAISDNTAADMLIGVVAGPRCRPRTGSGQIMPR
jgi:beta-lactamase class A